VCESVCVRMCVCVCVSVCVWVCVLHLAVTVTLYHHYFCSKPSVFTYNLIRCLQWMFNSWPDLRISQTNCSLGPHITRGLSKGASRNKLNIFVNNKKVPTPIKSIYIYNVSSYTFSAGNKKKIIKPEISRWREFC